MIAKGTIFEKTVEFDKKVATAILYNFRKDGATFYANSKTKENNLFHILYLDEKDHRNKTTLKVRKSLNRFIDQGFLTRERTSEVGNPIIYTVVKWIDIATRYKIPLNQDKGDSVKNINFAGTISTKAIVSLLSIINDFELQKEFSINDVIEKWDETSGKVSIPEISSALNTLVNYGVLSQLCQHPFTYSIRDNDIFNELTKKCRLKIINSTKLNTDDFTHVLKLIYNKKSFLLDDMFKIITEAGYKITIDEMTSLMHHLVWHGIFVNEANSLFYKRGENGITFMKTETPPKEKIAATPTEETPKMETTETLPEEKIAATPTEETPKMETTTKFPTFPSINDLETGNLVMDFIEKVYSVYGDLHKHYEELVNELEGTRDNDVDSKQKIVDLTEEVKNLTKDKEVLNDSLSQTASALLTAKTTIGQQKQKITSLEESINRNLTRRTIELKPLD